MVGVCDVTASLLLVYTKYAEEAINHVCCLSLIYILFFFFLSPHLLLPPLILPHSVAKADLSINHHLLFKVQDHPGASSQSPLKLKRAGEHEK